MMAMCTRRAALLATGVLLASTIASPLFAKPQRQMKVYFINTGIQTTAVGKLLFVSNPAQTFFTIKVSGLTPGAYDLMLNGVAVDTLTVNNDGEGKISQSTRVHGKHASATPLPYDPRGGDIEVMAVGVAVLSAAVPGTPAEAQQKTHIQTDLTNMGIQVGATSRAIFDSRFGRIQFEVEVNDALPGTYDLMVDGVKKGEIVVDASGSGQIQFDSLPGSDDDGNVGLDELLTFDPRGKMLTVVQGADTDFSEMFPTL